MVHQMRDENVPLNGVIIRNQAQKLADELGIKGFKASQGWLWKLKRRHDIGWKRTVVNAKSEDDWVWDYFTKIDQQEVFCTLCQKVIQRSEGLKDHLALIHFLTKPEDAGDGDNSGEVQTREERCKPKMKRKEAIDNISDDSEGTESDSNEENRGNFYKSSPGSTSSGRRLLSHGTTEKEQSQDPLVDDEVLEQEFDLSEYSHERSSAGRCYVCNSLSQPAYDLKTKTSFSEKPIHTFLGEFRFRNFR